MEDKREESFVIELMNANGDKVFTSAPVSEQTVKDVLNLRRDHVALGPSKMGIQVQRSDGAMTYISSGVIDKFLVSYLLASNETE